ncbi:MAG: rod shape-determining protein MreD [Xenococcaceae cyanobacterium MO_207.B15]|nr:rod shape-determining protein MreD [Xenococcaceae cyanobacterium MO_207.B15]
MVLYWLNILMVIGSVMVCAMLMLSNLPGLELLGITPNWLLIWLVTWSVKRSVWQGAIAGIAVGWIHDAIVMFPPSHVLSLVVVGVITASLNKQKYIGEDLISVALIVFFMTLLAETMLAFQHSWQHNHSLSTIWSDYQRIALTSAIITSVWTPAIYFPLNRWWQNIKIHNL